jgi:hypothetical protein
MTELLAPLLLFAMLFWGSFIVTVAIEVVRFVFWLAGGVLMCLWVLASAIGYCVWWLFKPADAGAALREAQRDRASHRRN